MQEARRTVRNAANATKLVPSVELARGQLRQAVRPFEAIVEYRAVADLQDNRRNARLHSPKQVQQIAASIREFGFLVPVLIDENQTILAGHGRVAAAKLLALGQVPTIRIEHLTPERKRAFQLADNRLAELSNWDEEILEIELLELSSLELDFEFEISGFDTVDLDRFAVAHLAQTPPAEQVLGPDRNMDAVSAPGDVWQLGRHRLFCGNALDEESYRLLLRDERAQMVFTDPPYNVKIDRHVCGLGSVKHEAFKMAAGEMTEEEFIEFLSKAMRLMADFSIAGSLHFVCMDWRHDLELQLAARPIYGRAKQVVVWNKTNAGMGTFYRSKHEFIFVFKSGSGTHVNNFRLGERGRYRTNVWDYAGVNAFKRERMAELSAHPTVKPLPLVVDALKDCSVRRGIILDPFAGSGTTILAAEKTGRIARAMELDPHYVDVAIGRWQTLTGKSATHFDSGRSFDDVARSSRDRVA